MTSTLRVKVLLAFLIVAMFPLMALALFNYRTTRQALTNSANQTLFAAASQTAERLDAFITAELRVISTEAQLPALAEYLNLPPDQREDSEAKRQIIDILQTFAQKDTVFISSYGLLDLEGQNVIDTDTSNIGGDESARDYFQMALETGLAYVSPVEFTPDDRTACLCFSRVIYTATGQPVGVLRVRYSVAILQQAIVQVNGLIGPQSYSILLDENGLFLADGLSSPGSPSSLLHTLAMPLDPARTAELEAARRLPPQPVDTLFEQMSGLADGLARVDSPEPYFTVQRNAAGIGSQAAVVTRMKTRPWLVIFLEPQESFLAPARTQARNTVVLAVMTMILVAVAAFGAARVLTAPIIHLTDAARQVAKGNLDAKARVESNDEIGVLAEAFNSMTSRLVETLEGLRTSEENYRGIIENAVEGIFRTSLEGRLLSANPAMANLLAFDSPDELVADLANIREQLYVRPKDRDAFLSVILERGTANGLEFQFRRKDKQTIWVSINARLVRDDAGTPLLIEGFITDITERKQAEQERLANLRFLEIMDKANRAFQGIDDLEQMMSDVLDTVLSTFDCDRAWLVYPCDLEATSWHVPMERTRPQYTGALAQGVEVPMDPEVLRVFQIVRTSDGPVPFGPESKHSLPEGTTERFRVKSMLAMAIYPRVDKPYMFGMHQCSHLRVWTPEEEGLFQEIGRRLADALTGLLTYRKLRDSENRYRRITEGLTDYQYTVRVENGRAVETKHSMACATVTGYTLEEFAADPHLWIRMVVPEDHELVLEHIRQILSGKETPPIEHRICHKDGDIRWVKDTTILFKDASGNLLSYDGVIKDITERKRAEEEIRNLNQELEQRVLDRTAKLEVAIKEHEAFTYSVAHDLRAPLRHVEGFTELLHQRIAPVLDEQSEHYMATISDAARRIGMLIDNLLSFSQLGRRKLVKRPVNLAYLVHDVIRELAPTAPDRDIHWHVADLPRVIGDRELLRLVLVDLISNALKFTQSRQRAVIEIGYAPDEKNKTVIYVRDNGVGFDMQYVNKLFGVFQRLHRVEEFEGTGIGLANVRRIIDRHGGRTWAEGEIDQGAVFYFSLPTLRQET